MKIFLEALNHPADAFQRGKFTVSCTLVAVTALLNAVFVQILSHFFSEFPSAWNVFKMLKVTAFSALTYVIICLAFWLVCKCYGSKSTFMGHLKAWGTTYYPTAVCAVVVPVTEVFFYVFWNSTIWGILINFVFGGILIWKAILYIIYLKDFAGLKGWRFAGAFVAMGVIIIVMAALDGYLGVITPGL
ncbi:MAG TPA: hypothetical protein VJY54_05830 [Lachnospiraceae bacterium]|nr:hypothetical protein [Lachnospiraceae bacterium]